MDNDQGQEEKKDRKEAPPPPRPDGVRRSRRLQNHPPPPPAGAEGGGSYSASDRKRPRLQEKEEAKGPQKEVGDGDADRAKVKVNFKANVKGRVSEAEGGGRALPQEQKRPLLGKAKVGGGSKVEDATLKEEGEAGKASSSGTQEIWASENFTTEGEGAATPPLKNSNLISNGGGDQVPVGGAGTDINVEDADFDSTGPSAVLEPPAPLLNSVVLTNLFELCPPADLAKFRLVCKEWRDLSLKAWRISATLKLERTNRRICTEGGTPLDQLMEYVEDPGKECEVKPFRRMQLEGWTFNPSKRQIERFWNLTGSYLTSLDLHECRFSGAEEFWRITYDLCPNIRRLCLNGCSFKSGKSMSNPVEPQLAYKEPVRGRHGHLKCLVISYSKLPVSLLELLSHFDSLTSLKVKADSASIWENLLSAIKVIRKHSGNNLPLPIKDFDVQTFEITHDKASHNKFLLVRELNLPLKSLTLCAHPQLDLRFVSDILELYSGTLENLEVNGPESQYQYGDGSGEWQFPCPVRLEKLQYLEIENAFLESLDILKSVPNLRSLYISFEDGAVDRLETIFDKLEDWQVDNSTTFLPKLTTLFYCGSFGHRKNLVTLAKLMPNLEELDMTLNDEEFSTVCANWKGLKELIVFGNEEDDEDHLTDNGLTGGNLQIEKPDMRWVHKAVHPSITDLKELRSFWCESNKLTEISVYHGFLLLPALQTITLLPTDRRASPRDYFGEEARNDLREKGITLR